MTNMPIIATTITLVFDVSSAPVYTPPLYGPMFPKTLEVRVFDGGQTAANLAAFKVRRDGTQSAVAVNPYIPMDDRRNVPWIAECIATAIGYAGHASAFDAEAFEVAEMQP
jgi:hypothetical protein